MPRLSDTMTEGKIVSWNKKVGDKIKPGDVLADVETDKATMEFEAVDEGRIGKTLVPDHHGYIIPPFMAMVILIVIGFTVLGLAIRSRLSLENPGKLQIILEDAVSGLAGMLTEWLGPKGVNYLPLIGTLGAFILAGNYLGLIPGFMSPTSSINVTIGCALTTWVFYHLQGVRAHGVVSYIKHFAVMPGEIGRAHV